jgi:transcriptional regulator GlxA family with amidase domain
MPGTPSFVLYGLYEVMSAAGITSAILAGRPLPKPLLDVRIATDNASAHYESDGKPIKTIILSQAASADVVIVPDVLEPPENAIVYPKEVALLRRAHDRGATIASVCNGAIVVAASGLLDDANATTHWALRDYFRKRYPKVRLHLERVLVRAGGDRHVITAGGTASWQDLALYLIAAYCGPEEAVRVAKCFILSTNVDGQLPYASMPREFQTGDSLIGKIQSWIADNYKQGSAVAAMAEMAGLPLRTFARRFRKATGYAPLDYVQALRIEEAKQLLETTQLQVEAIGAEVGYADTTSFRRLFKRLSGLTPGAYRRKFDMRAHV